MRTLYFDCFSGISGDMTIGALLDLGIDHSLFRRELEKLNLEGYELKIARKSQSGIEGIDITVSLTENGHGHEHDHEHNHSHGNEHDHEHEHKHEHEHGHEHEHEHEHGHEHKHSHGGQAQSHSHGQNRNFYDIEKIICSSNVSDKVKHISTEIFRKIAAAEAKVHGKTIDEVHFHEVGAVDSIVDIVGTAICLDILGVDRVVSSPLSDGKGFIKCQHGTIPVPVPAVLEIAGANRVPMVQVDVNTELVTPTGAGIIAYLAQQYGNMPPMRIIATGYGMGKRETGRPNMLRLILGEDFDLNGVKDESVIILETNIDNMNSEIAGYTMERLLENGALDVFYTPIQMKKNRPAMMLSVVCDKEKEEEMADIILEETTTLGIRKYSTQRYVLPRKISTVSTPMGQVRVKVSQAGKIRKAAPEYEDCRAIAASKGIPLREVYAAAMESVNKEI